MNIYKNILIILMLSFLFTSDIFADTSAKTENVKKSPVAEKLNKNAKLRAYVPNNVINEAYDYGEKTGYITGMASRNIVVETYKASEELGYKTGKKVKSFWKSIWR